MAVVRTIDAPADGSPPWHSLPAADVLAAVNSSDQGLTSEEAARRLDEIGPNRLPSPRRHGPLVRFLLQFHNILIYVLLGSAVVTAAMAHWVDTAVIVGVVVVNAVIGFLQEGRAERALDAIGKMLSPRASVLRDGRRLDVDAEVLVPGDVVVIESGDKVPADLRLLETKSLQAQEAALTGESAPVVKEPAQVDVASALGDRGCMAYAGTLVASGRGRGVVVATGAHSEIGRISTLLSTIGTLTTPLLEQIGQFSRVLTALILILAAVVFAIGVLAWDFTSEDMFLAAVGLAVAAIPEGLPAIMTITLAIGVQRMARRNAIVRRLPAVETLGSVSVICTDKTGTLTRNEMMVESIACARRLIDVDGEGYAPHGRFLDNGREIDPDALPILREMLRGALLCSDAELLDAGDGDWRVNGDPTEGALVCAAVKAGLDPTFEKKAQPRTDVIPFESEHRFMATLHHDHQGSAVVYVKGAPERILDMCRRERKEDGDAPLDAAFWRSRAEEISARGQRVLALAAKPTPPDRHELRFDDVERGLVLLGLFGLADPPRGEALGAVQRCREAGIRVKMITGDHAGTARAIARSFRLPGADTVLTGSDLDALDDAALSRQAADVDVFARTSPQHKLRLVEALQSQGLIVAMTGDGVNDAPALKRADIGVAMGKRGTEAAKEAAQMVLADDNFASIAHAVEEGRTVYDNLQKAILFILATNGSQALTIILAVLLGETLPITAVQILWINMVTAVTLSMALAFERPEADVMTRPPRRRAAPLLSPLMLWRIGFVSIIILAGVFGMFEWQLRRGADIDTARTTAVNTLVAFEMAYLFSARHRLQAAFARAGIRGIRPALIAVGLTIVLQVAFTWWEPMQGLFRTRALDLVTCAVIAVSATSVLLLVETEKAAFRHVLRRRERNRGRSEPEEARL
jgi:magnesium-transporting ATPase (P-type)